MFSPPCCYCDLEIVHWFYNIIQIKYAGRPNGIVLVGLKQIFPVMIDPLIRNTEGVSNMTRSQ